MLHNGSVRFKISSKAAKARCFSAQAQLEQNVGGSVNAVEISEHLITFRIALQFSGVSNEIKRAACGFWDSPPDHPIRRN